MIRLALLFLCCFAARAGSYVPLDSWIYPALDRLSGLGLISTQSSGLRPWTREECRRQLREADRRAAEAPEGLLAALHREFDADAERGTAISLDTVYLRSGILAGPLLRDGYHFGQTWANDQGRPFGRGWNSYTGVVARANAGRFFAAVQAEYQRAPGADAYSLPVRETIARLDGIPLPSANPIPDSSRARTIEAYGGVRLGNFELSAGKQALWWGPTYDSPFSFGANAEPTKNARLSTVHPIRLGPVGVRGELVIGKLGGHRYTWRPWFNAQKLSFVLTPNLEVGFTRWSIFWGVGHPITVGSLARNFASTTSPDRPVSDPGDRKGGFDFRYRIPGLRRWVTLYTDSYCDDDPSPLAAPRRAAINPGIHLARVPGLERLDLRVEAPSTQLMATDRGGQFVYFNNQYRSGNTNYGNLLGNSVGRDGRALEAWAGWWFGPRDRLEAGYRQAKGSAQFLPGGSTQSDATVRGSFQLTSGWSATALVQYERAWVPVVGPPVRNLSGWVQISWEPDVKFSAR